MRLFCVYRTLRAGSVLHERSAQLASQCSCCRAAAHGAAEGLPLTWVVAHGPARLALLVYVYVGAGEQRQRLQLKVAAPHAVLAHALQVWVKPLGVWFVCTLKKRHSLAHCIYHTCSAAKEPWG